jgi:hypothetical protein
VARSLKVQIRSGDTVFFMHLPKAGGTTFYAILEQYFPAEACFSVPDREYQQELPPHLDQYRLVRAHQGYDAYRYFKRKPIYITMLRNPVARTISYYQHIMRQTSHPMHERIKQGSLSLIDCLKDPILEKHLVNTQTRRLAFGNGAVDDLPSGEVQLEMAKVRLHEFAYFGLVEYYMRSVQLLTYTFGWPSISEIKPLNAAPMPEMAQELPPAVREAILLHNQLDLDLYNYAEQLFQERYRQLLSELIARRSGGRTWSASAHESALANQRHYQAMLNLTAAGRLVQMIRRARRRIIPENSIWEHRYYRLQEGLYKRLFSKQAKG